MKNFISLLIFLLFLGTGESQVLFSEDFEDGTQGWSFIENDGNGESWVQFDYSYNYNPDFGDVTIISFSNESTPDNLAVSPMIDLSGVTINANTQLALEYQFMTQANNPEEKYSVYLTTSPNLTDILNSTPVYTETAQTGSILHSRKLDVSAYAGQMVYIVFRHYDCNANFIMLDNIELRKIGENDVKLNQIQLGRFALINQDNNISVDITNHGNNNITSLKLNWSDGTESHTSDISLNLQPGESQTITHPVSVNYSNVRESNISVTATQVNGTTDFDVSNNQLNVKFNTLSQSAQTKVLIEEGTGTWCGYCPRGAVAMDYASENHHDIFVGVAVHNNDPMMNNEYNNRADFSSFPGMNVDRFLLKQDISNQLIEQALLSRSGRNNPVSIQIQPILNGNELTVNTSATFYTNFTNVNYRLATIIVEDNVQNDEYDQVNYFSGQSEPMGGYENLPNPVPGEQMIYNHVGRDLLGGYDGQENSIPPTLSDGQTVSYSFNYTIPSDYVTNNLKVVVIVIDADNGQIINAEELSLGELSINEVTINQGFTIYPNPASNFVNIKINETGNYAVKIYDLAGKPVLTYPTKDIDKNSTFSIPLSGLSKGVYLISLEGNRKSFNKKLIVK